MWFPGKKTPHTVGFTEDRKGGREKGTPTPGSKEARMSPVPPGEQGAVCFELGRRESCAENAEGSWWVRWGKGTGSDPHITQALTQYGYAPKGVHKGITKAVVH